MVRKNQKLIITASLLIVSLIATLAIIAYFKDYNTNIAFKESSIDIRSALSGKDTAGFLRADKVIPINFPDALGPNNKYKTEWWYFTGNLEDSSGRRFGYQFTIFRIGTKPSKFNNKGWEANNIFMAHLAISDIGEGKFLAYERFSRGAAGLAGADSGMFKVWVEDWYVMSTGGVSCYGVPPMDLNAREKDLQIRLKLDNTKPPVLQGDSGLSRKGTGLGNASYYFSLTRMNTSGVITFGNLKFNVKGTSWMDKEWSTSSLDSSQAGWDWFSMQLDDGSEIMYYQLRKKDGLPDLHSSGKIISATGNMEQIDMQDIKLKVTEFWESPYSKIKYPSKWQFSIPDKNLELLIEPMLKNQELPLSIIYWEGAVRITGQIQNKKVTGYGYAELTGYYM